ncbi:hypothetical protein WA026_005732 [Henosepilachna vigintioctopunctata]|uniref:Major facilitator superfamily (MFS) profile domain-containing protein n=1 Tax=Henosepilachna vigintioctopunctata TaxID=420089 RepID=A0AAW1TTM1_9CUCU
MTSKHTNDALNKFSFLKNYRIYMTYFSVCILVFMSGTTTGWTSPMIQKLNHTDDNPVGRRLTIDESSWLAAISPMGIIIGCLICGALGKLIGRKPLMISMGVPYAIFCLIMVFTQKPWLYIFARLLSGITAGSVLVLCPMYFSELAKSEQRGRLFIVLTISNNLGSLYALSVGPFVSFIWFHISLAIFPILYLIFFSIFAYESPYVVIRRDPAKGEELLKKIRYKNDVSEEVQRIQKGFLEDKGMNIIQIFKSKATRRALFITLTLAVCVMLCGNATVLSYTQFIFEKAGGVWSAETNTIVVSAFQLFIAVASSPLEIHSEGE